MIKNNRTSFVTRVDQLLRLLIIGILLSGFMSMSAFAADPGESIRAASVPNPGTGLWLDVRQRNEPVVGSTQVQGVDSGVLINIDGMKWRDFRMQQLAPYSAYLLAAILAIIVLFRLIRGKIKIKSGRSGEKLLRFTSIQKITHWVVAITFVLLGLTGVIILLGRKLLIPVFGTDAFATLALISKVIHDYIGPVFAIALLVMLVTFIKGNFFRLKDIGWFAKAGGMLGGGHVSAGRYNAGEKTWFWLAILGGAVVVVSGLVLDFPIFDLPRETMESAHMFHGISAIIVLAASLGHMYLGTVGMEGAFETMVTGYCDSNWAKEHHDEWYEEMKDSAKTEGDHGAMPSGIPASTNTET